ncbi:MAG: proton-conducting transporter membrane subunit [Pseudomonadota bacterium]
MLAETLALLPELILASAAVAIVVFRTFIMDRALEFRTFGMTALALAGLAFWIILYGEGARFLSGDLLIEDAFSRVSQVFVLLASAAALAIGMEGGQRATARDPYVLALFLMSVLGLLLVSAAADLLALFLGFQLYSVSLYVLIALRENSGRAVAAGLRTALSGFFCFALVLFGIVLVIWATGATSYEDLADLLTEAPSPLFSMGLAILLAGLAFALALAPFHLWLQLALEATPWPIVALVVGAAPLALLSGFARLVSTAFGEVTALWQPVLAGFGLLSVVAGFVASFAALRLSHLCAAFATMGAGFGVMALSADSVAGTTSMLASMMLQGAALVGMIAFVARLEKNGQAVDTLRDLSGLSSSQMPQAFAVLLLLLSAAAVPPLAGFVVRLHMLQAMYESGLIWQSVAGVCAMAAASFAFLRPAWQLYMAPMVSDVDIRSARLPDLILAGSAGLTVLALISLGGLEAVLETAASRLER